MADPSGTGECYATSGCLAGSNSPGFESRGGAFKSMNFNRLATAASILSLAVLAVPAASTAASPAAPAIAQYGDQGGYANPVFQARRRGFEEGIEGAIKDFGNHRAPNPNNRDEFRHPPVPGPLRDPYRDGFRRGYQQAMSELMNGGGKGINWYREQSPRGQARMRGFQDGMEGAMHDFDNHRRPDPDNRDEFRNPPVPYPMQEAYRNGFRRGYNVAMKGLMGLPAGH
jgi:opacity protein-like surface antigen